jgi:hypothetical protein
MPLRLVYLPDPALKFYYCSSDKEYYTTSELTLDEIKNKSELKFIQILIRPKRAHYNILKNLQKKFRAPVYPQPYFENTLNRIELFEILEVPNGKALKTGA